MNDNHPARQACRHTDAQPITRLGAPTSTAYCPTCGTTFRTDIAPVQREVTGL